MDRPLAGGSALALRLRPRAPTWVARARRPLRFLARHRRARLALLVLLVCAPLLGGGFLWLRHSSLVAVEHVRFSGVSGPQAAAIRAALTTASHGMSTLDVRTARLRAAVARFPVVRDLRASSSLPHGLHITVDERPPVAALVAAGARTAAASDGVVLGSALLSSKLPTISLPAAPPPGRRVQAGWAGAALTILGAAPAPLLGAATRVFEGPKGVTIAFRSGLQAYFGDAGRAHAKWQALALVVAAEHASGASYVDVRVPERAAAGFPSGTPPPPTNSSGEGHSTTETVSASESSASLAAALRLAGGEGPATEAGEGGGASETAKGSGEASSRSGEGEEERSTATEHAAGGH